MHLFYLSQNIVITVSKEFTVGYASSLPSEEATADALNLLQMGAKTCLVEQVSSDSGGGICELWLPELQ